MNDNDLQLFNRQAIRTKRELLEAIDEYVTHLEQHEDIEIVRKGRTKPLASVMNEFRDKVARAPLADLKTAFTAYRVEITDTKIELIIDEFDDMVFDEDGEMVETSASYTPGIIEVNAPYIPIKEFAEMQGVQVATVRQWIRRGKIRNVQKLGSEWLIASTEGKPERGFTSGMFYCADSAGDMSELFPLKKGVHSIELWKTNQCGEECLATMRDSNYNVLEEIKLNRVSREKLEHALAASPEVRFQSTFIDEINRKVSSDDSPGHCRGMENYGRVFSGLDGVSVDSLLKCLGGENYTRNLSISLTHLCFRNGPVEDMHADGKLDDSDMMLLNKYMVDHLGFFFLLLGLSDIDSLKQVLRFHEQCGLDWDDPDVLKLLNDYDISSERLKALPCNRNQLSRRDCMSESER